MSEMETQSSEEVSTEEGNIEQRAEGTKIRLMVVGHVSGALIGKGGENMRRLRETHGVKITGLSSRAAERVLQMDGECTKCLNVIEELLPVMMGDARYSPTSDGKGSPAEVNILVNTELAGRIVGKGGSKMREVSEATGCKMKVFPKCLPNSNERVVALGADDETTLMKGITMVVTILDAAHHKPPTTYFQEANNNDPLAMMDIANNNNTGINNSSSTEVEDPNPLNRPLYKMILDQIQYKRENPVEEKIDFGQLKTTATLTMSNEMCGAVIGKGGQNIRAVRSASMAHIEFTRADKDSGVDRTVTITGTADQVRVAQELLGHFVKKSLFASGIGGGGAASGGGVENSGGNSFLESQQQQYKVMMDHVRNIKQQQQQPQQQSQQQQQQYHHQQQQQQHEQEPQFQQHQQDIMNYQHDLQQHRHQQQMQHQQHQGGGYNYMFTY